MVAKWEETLSVGTANMRIDFPNPDQSETYYKELGTQAKDQNQFVKEMKDIFLSKIIFLQGNMDL